MKIINIEQLWCNKRVSQLIKEGKTVFEVLVTIINESHQRHKRIIQNDKSSTIRPNTSPDNGLR